MNDRANTDGTMEPIVRTISKVRNRILIAEKPSLIVLCIIQDIESSPNTQEQLCLKSL
jgi:hypothetical protein